MWDSNAPTLKDLISKAPDVDRLPPVPEPLREARAWIRALQIATAHNATGSKDEKGLKFPEWMIQRVRVFHPRAPAHQAIMEAIVNKRGEQPQRARFETIHEL